MTMTQPHTAGRARNVVFTFPGQGAYRYAILRELYTAHPQAQPAFRQAEAVAQRLLGCGFLPLVEAASQPAHDAYLAAHPDLDQLGIYLTEVLVARLLMERGVQPHLLAGHSFGDLAALATAGVYSLETGLEIVCRRVQALQRATHHGRMAALTCGVERARALLAALDQHTIEVSVVNHPTQTVVSGPLDQLRALEPLANAQGVSVTILQSRYPFHSSYLREAVAAFRDSLQGLAVQPPRIPVLVSTEQRLYTPADDLAALLAGQFVTPLDFQPIPARLYAEGYRVFVECGAGHIVSKLVRRNLPDAADLATVPAAPAEGLAHGLEAVTRLAEERGLIQPVAGAVPASLVEALRDLVEEMTRLTERANTLLQQVSEHTPPRFARHPSQEGTTLASRTEVAAEETKPSVGATDVLLKDVHSPLERGGPTPSGRGVSANDANQHNARVSRETRPHQSSVFSEETCPDVPIAIVSMGCVLPGSGSPDAYWKQIQEGTSGVVDLTDADPEAGLDFVAGSADAIVPDKTYTLLNGAIRAVPYDAALLGEIYSKAEFDALTKGQKLLAVALAQSRAGLQAGAVPEQARLQCILGATADGSSEYDDALFADSLYAALDTLDEPAPLRDAFARHIETLTGYGRGTARRLEQHPLYEAVVAQVLGRAVGTYVVDSACSSSLYALDLGAKALRAGEADVVLAGGVFAPGPANNALFAQFRGLTPTQSRPLDARADGVVFGDGAALVALKRLPDALADGDTVHAVVRGTGLSSDGKSPSINVPQAQGQSLAMRKAYEQAHVSLDTLQYIEAHATATPVGDAVEFASITQALEGRDPALPPVALGSVKALIGHTGWVSGVASVIKLCRAFAAAEIPRQYHYEAPNPKIDLSGAPLTIPRETHPWPANVGGLPRRAGVNAFGFGGTNAHVILEAFDEAYHRHLCEGLGDPAPLPTLAVVGVGSLFPASETLAADAPGDQARFDRALLRLPAKKLLLPDVTDHMDASQYLAALAAEQIFDTLPNGWLTAHREGVGVVLGLAAKTERGARANDYVFLDRLHRRAAAHTPVDLERADAERLLAGVVEAVKAQGMPSGPYTLPGLMPNVAASRIPSLFNLNGPNMVVDRGSHSLFQALDAARHLLAHGDCTMVLTGGLHAFAEDEAEEHEAALLLALTTLDTARQDGLPVLGTLTLSDEQSANTHLDVATAGRFGGAQGVRELYEACRRMQQHKESVAVRAHPGLPGAAQTLVLAPDSYFKGGLAEAGHHREKSPLERGGPTQSGRGVSARVGVLHDKKNGQTALEVAIPATASEAQRATHAFIQATPIATYTPERFAEAARRPAIDLAQRRILFLVDDPATWEALTRSAALDALTYTVACPAGIDLPEAVAIDLTSDDTVAATIQALDALPFDTIIAVKDLEAYYERTLVQHDFEHERALLDLLFVVSRHAYDRVLQGEVDLAALCLGAYTGAQLNPYTGLIAGFVKSLAREAPEATCCIVGTDEPDARRALAQVAVELGQPAPRDEVCYRGGQRYRMKLQPVEALAQAEQPFLDASSVVLATGGGRGVTAILAEDLLQRYGCTVVAVGRTDPEAAPEALRALDEAAFKEYEGQFYRDELARDGTQKIKALKQRYERYQAVNELNGVIRRLQALPGTFVYRRLDINDADAVEAVVTSVSREYGTIDLVVHGAGIQDSRAMPKKSLARFRQIVFTKLGSLRHIYRACTAQRRDRPLHMHLLTSAFSYLGNDGQPDYGAANETLNRLAAAMNALEPDAHWSAMAWLGWASIGMTRGSEFAALAARRRLRGVTKEEGQALFARLLAGPPASAIVVTLAEGERQHYQPTIAAANEPAGLLENASPAAPALRTPRDAAMTTLDLSIDNAPFLYDHTVHGVPTLPGAFLLRLTAEAAHNLRPNLKITAFEDTRFLKFVKVFPQRPKTLRLDARVVHEDADGALVRVQVLSDFYHKSGLLLQQDIVQTEVFIRMATTLRPKTPGAFRLNGLPGLHLPDPYVMDGSALRLGGQFDSMGGLIVGEAHRKARYQLSEATYPPSPHRHLLPNVIMVDAFWRFGTVQPGANRSLAVYVPTQCRTMKVYFDYTDPDLAALTAPVLFEGTNPREDGDLLHVGPIAAYDPDGHLLLEVEDGLCRKFGAIENAF